MKMQTKMHKTALSLSLIVYLFIGGGWVCAKEPVFSVTGYLVPQPVSEKTYEWRSKRTAKETSLAQEERYEKFIGDGKDSSFDDEDKMFDSIFEYLKNNPSKKLLFYIHGCCHLYPKTLPTAQKLSEKFNEPVLIYNWPSSPFHIEPGKLGSIFQPRFFNSVVLKHNGYSENEQGYSNGKGQFSFFFQRFDKSLIKHSIDPNRVILIAHSMGNRMLDDGVEIRSFIIEFGKDKPLPFSQIIFACADVGMEEFQDFSRLDRVTKNAGKIWFLINRKDPALEVSSKIHGYFRVGNAPVKKCGPLLLGENTFVVDHTAETGKSHDMPIDLIYDMVTGERKTYDLIPSEEKPHLFEAKKLQRK
ncbi:MAG: alpha/beta hydrolase [Cyanobacteria bacterium TGS_CYA1]|nr:alpha/beta hydrolase [Cyanobacteria bacterium TGS_CYA1]